MQGHNDTIHQLLKTILISERHMTTLHAKFTEHCYMKSARIAEKMLTASGHKLQLADGG